MIGQPDVWVILGDPEYHDVWHRFDQEFRFAPASDRQARPPWRVRPRHDVYDLGATTLMSDDERPKRIVRDAFVECLGTDEFMYVLDWQHTCFRYNPRIEDRHVYPVFMPDERYLGGGYNVYFPEFYPNGDYYFFLARDFRWGYLTHPWLHRAWVFGDPLRELFHDHADELGFVVVGGSRR